MSTTILDFLLIYLIMCTNIVITMAEAKKQFLQIRIRQEVKDDLAIIAKASDRRVSNLVHYLITSAISKAKTENPELFETTSEGSMKNLPTVGRKISNMADELPEKTRKQKK